MAVSSLPARRGAVAAGRSASAASVLSRRALVVRGAQAGEGKAPSPSWLPAEAKPVVDFFVAEDVKLSTVLEPVVKSDIYTKYLQSYAESPVAKESLGWKQLPETINGRAAMLGFVAGASAEVFGAGPLLSQAAALPQAVVLTLLLVVASSVIPLARATQGDYLASLRDVYSIPEGLFTETNEKLHGRVAMLGLTSLLAIELLTGHALL